LNCVICRIGQTKPGAVTVTLQRGDCTVVVKDVPADVCENCGEYYLSEAVTDRLLKRADEACRRGAEVEILRYAA
jgi:YgiT-type zinc finger domain-containing protein